MVLSEIITMVALFQCEACSDLTAVLKKREVWKRLMTSLISLSALPGKAQWARFI